MVPNDISDQLLNELNISREWLDTNWSIFTKISQIMKLKGHKGISMICELCNAEMDVSKWYRHHRDGLCENKPNKERGNQECGSTLLILPKELLNAYELPVGDNATLNKTYRIIKKLAERTYREERFRKPLDLVSCVCGADFINGCDEAHARSQKHQRYLRDKQLVIDYRNRNTKKETIIPTVSTDRITLE
jgi:hypothetical protein